MPFSPQEFQKSINKEFILVKDREIGRASCRERVSSPV